VKKLNNIAVFLFAMAMAPGYAQKDTRSAVNVYTGDVQYVMLMCSMALELALLKGNEDANADWRSCIADSKKDIKRAYETALKTVKKPLARAALKEHYISSTAAISAVAPEPGETKSGYAMRQGQSKQKLAEQFARFEIEN